MSNNNVNTTNKSTGKRIFDLISLSALKVEVVLMVGVIIACAVRVTTTFIL